MKLFIHDKCQAIQAQRQILISAPSFITSSLSGRRAADQRDVVSSLLQGLGMNLKSLLYQCDNVKKAN